MDSECLRVSGIRKVTNKVLYEGSRSVPLSYFRLKPGKESAKKVFFFFFFFKSLLNLLQYWFWFIFSFSQGMWDLSSLTRD